MRKMRRREPPGQENDRLTPEKVTETREREMARERQLTGTLG